MIGCGSGRAVAAGGDVRHMVAHSKKGENFEVERYLRAEYQFYYLMNTLPCYGFFIFLKLENLSS